MEKLKYAISYFMPAITAVAIASLLYTAAKVLWHPFFISGISMEPNYHDGEIVSTIPYHGEDLAKGTVVIVNLGLEKVIKRIEGTPGESFATDSGEIQLADDEYYILGDNRGHSVDSRTYGPIRSVQIIGVVDTKLLSKES